MPTASTNSARFLVISLFAILAVLLSFAAAHLPNGAGPDEGHTLNAVKFYQFEKRLAVFPADNDAVHFSAYGSTRVIRPPFPFAFAALTGSLNLPTAQAFGGFRYASAITLAACISLIFWVLYRFGFRPHIALLATVLITSLPQFLFHGTYMSDDAGAFLAASLQMGSALYLVKNGITRKWLIATSAIIGFTLINKITGWIGLPTLFLIFLLYVKKRPTFVELKPAKTLLWMLVAFFLCGGFWVVHNVINYGADPFLMRLNGELARQFARLEAPNDQGYLMRHNMSYLQVITNRDFLVGSFRAFVGNLDLLRLPVGPLAYIWFAIILIIAVISYLFSLRRYPKFAIYCTIWISMQIFMYLHFNVAEDIQIQGKYILPIVPLIAFYLALALDAIKFDKKADERFLLSIIALASVSVSLFTFHNRIYPFYRPPPVDFYTDDAIEIINDARNIRETDNLNIDRGSTINVRADGDDPKMFLNPIICKKLAHNFIIRARFSANANDHLRIYIGNEKGYQASKSFATDYDEGKQDIWLPVSHSKCLGIRIDPMSKEDIVLRDFSLEIIPYTPRIKRSR